MDPPAVAATATTAPPSPADEQEARRRALLLEARRARLAWVRDDDYEELEDPTEALLRSLEHDHDEDDADHKGDDDDGTAALPSGWRRGRVSELLAHAAAAAAAGPDGETGAGALLLPSAREYVAFLNRLVGEGDAEAVHYPAAALRARLPGDAALLRGGEGEGEGDGAVGMPPLPALPTRDGDELTYEAFVARLAHPLSAEVVGALQRYVAGFVRRQRRRAREQGAAAEEPLDAEAMEGGIDAVAEGLHAFIDGLRAEMRKSPAWRALVSEPDPLLLLPRQQPQPPPPPPPAGAGGGWEGVRDHLEAFLMMKLRRYLFTPRERAALAARDAALAGRLRALAFLGPEHLDVRSLLAPSPNAAAAAPAAAAPPISQTLAPAITALTQAVQEPTPRAVLNGLLATSRHITRALCAARRDGSLPGADEVLPALILAIKEGNPPGLRTALELVQRFRHPRRLHVSEAAYVFTNVASAVHFLETADAVQLNMTPDDLERSLAACHRLLVPPTPQPPPAPPSPRRPALSSSSSPSLSLSASAAQQQQQPPPFLGPLGDDVAALLSTTAILETVDHAIAPATAGPPPRLVSIQEIRRQRTMAAAAAAVPHPTQAAPPPPHPPAPVPSSSSLSPPSSPYSGITALAARVRAEGGRHPVTASEVLRGCRFLHATPEALRLSDMGALLEEHRALASLAADLARLLERRGGKVLRS